MGIRRAEVEKFAQEHGIELEITEFRKNYSNHGRAGINHVHAYTKTGEIFGGIDLHNMSVWDCDCAVAINWADVLADLCDHMPVPCPLCLANGGAGCEVCDDEPDEAEMDRIIEEKEMAFRNEVDAELLAEIQEKGGTL